MGKQAGLAGLGCKSSLHLRQTQGPVRPSPAAGHCRHVVAPDNVELVEADGEVEGKVLARIQRQLAGPAHLAARAIDSAKLGERQPRLQYVCPEGEIDQDGTPLQVIVATLHAGDEAIRFGRSKRAAGSEAE